MTAVLSDMDGVLVDSMASARMAWGAWGDRHGLDGVAIQEANHGRPAREIIALHVPAAEVDDDNLFVRMAEIAGAAGLRAYPGAAGILSLPRVAIVTSCELPLARARIAGAGLAAPAVVVTADMVARGKPAPDAYLLAADRLGVAPERCIVVEDAPAGIAAGRAAGMTVWAVTTTHAARELRDAHRVAAGLPELLAALERLPA